MIRTKRSTLFALSLAGAAVAGVATSSLAPAAEAGDKAKAGPSAAGDDAARKKAATEMVRLMVTRESYGDSISQMADQMLMSMQQQGATPPKDAPARLKKVVGECIPYEEMLAWSAEVYATHFTLKEIHDLSSFYRTTTGQKVARSLPELMAASGQKTAAVLMQRLPAAMKKHGLIPDSQGASPAAAPTREDKSTAPAQGKSRK